MAKNFDTDLIVGAVWKFGQLSSKEFDAVLRMQELKGYTPKYFEGLPCEINAKIDKDFPLSSEVSTEGLMVNLTNFTFKASKSLLDMNWREYLVYAYIEILLKKQLASVSPCPRSLYWRASNLTSIVAFLNHGSILSKNLDILPDSRINEVSNMTRTSCFTDSPLFQNMFAYGSISAEFILARIAICWHHALAFNFEKMLVPGRLELGYIASNAPRLCNGLEKVDSSFAAETHGRSALFSTTFDNVLRDLYSIRSLTPSLLAQGKLSHLDQNLMESFLKPAKRVSDYFLYYSLRNR